MCWSLLCFEWTEYYFVVQKNCYVYTYFNHVIYLYTETSYKIFSGGPVRLLCTCGDLIFFGRKFIPCLWLLTIGIVHCLFFGFLSYKGLCRQPPQWKTTTRFLLLKQLIRHIPWKHIQSYWPLSVVFLREVCQFQLYISTVKSNIVKLKTRWFSSCRKQCFVRSACSCTQKAYLHKSLHT